MNKVGEVGVYYKKKLLVEDIKITSSSVVVDFLKEMYDDKTVEYCECFYVIALNNSSEILSYSKISEGGLTSTVVDMRKIFQFLLNVNATAFIVTHNHPSGKTKPSEADIDMTKKISEAGKIMSISLLDHVIWTSDGYTSMTDKGYM